MNPQDLIHLQWTGSNTHQNGGGGGDGQTGDAGQGTDGTDRHNFVFMGDLKDNFPLPLDKDPAISMWNNISCYEIDGTPISQIDCQIRLATSGFYTGLATLQANRDNGLSPTLDNASPSIARGLLIKFNEGTVHHATMPRHVTPRLHVITLQPSIHPFMLNE